jgi:hypothetical protein
MRRPGANVYSPQQHGRSVALLSLASLADQRAASGTAVRQEHSAKARDWYQDTPHFKYLFNGRFRVPIYIGTMLKRPVTSKEVRRALEWSLITCGFALALVVIVSSIR